MCLHVIARSEATKQSILLSLRREMDRFASLAMTVFKLSSPG
jgi:hypothetical protein